MICKHCGMESATADRCSLCGQPLAVVQDEEAPPPTASAQTEAETETEAPLAAAQDAPPAPAAQKPTGERRPAPAMMPRSSGPTLRMPASSMSPGASRPTAPGFTPTPGREPAAPRFTLTGEPILETDAEPTAQAEGSTDAGISLQPVAELHATPSSPPEDEAPVAPRQPLPANLDGLVGSKVRPADRKAGDADDEDKKSPLPQPSGLLARYLAVFAPILLITAAVTHFFPTLFWVPLILAEFIGGLLLPVMRVVPWADEDSDDLIYFVLLTFIFGPCVSLVIYTTLGLIRRTVNPGLVGCMVLAAASMLTVMFTLGNFNLLTTTPFISNISFDRNLVYHLLLTWSGFVALAGWYTAGFFHKLDE